VRGARSDVNHPAPGLLVIGDVAWDIVLRPRGEIVRGSDVLGSVQLHPGGCAANVAVWAARLGARVRLAGKVGDDELGKVMVGHLTREGASEGLIVSPGAQTTRVAVLVDGGGERAFVTDPDTRQGFRPGDCPPSRIAGLDAVLVTGYGIFATGSASFLADLLAEARRRGVLIAFDPSSFEFIRTYGADRLVADVGRVDVLLVNEEEAAALRADREALADIAALVVIKMGERGAAAFGRDVEVVVRAPPIEIVDSTGAGDAFDAAFLVEYIRSRDPARALEAGNRLGAYVTGRLGAQPAWGKGSRPVS
jgi:sugar/nucleoside kinase (ribokinase family)